MRAEAMPSLPATDELAEATARPDVTRLVTRGVRRHLAQLGFASVTEVTLKGGRRADIIAMDDRGTLLIVEVKSGLADFAADGKWPDYTGFCDRFYFAVAADFPLDLIPAHCGLIVADGYEATVEREPEHLPLAGARRKAMLIRLARLAAAKLHRQEDPFA
ncbi:MAG: MmcB family DNA repair protein [Azospirillaceae bacterium]